VKLAGDSKLTEQIFESARKICLIAIFGLSLSLHLSAVTQKSVKREKREIVPKSSQVEIKFAPRDI